MGFVSKPCLQSMFRAMPSYAKLCQAMPSDAKLCQRNHHGPLSVNSGGLCGGKATAGQIMANEGILLTATGFVLRPGRADQKLA